VPPTRGHFHHSNTSHLASSVQKFFAPKTNQNETAPTLITRYHLFQPSFFSKTKIFHERSPFWKHGAHKQAHNRAPEEHLWKRLPRTLQTLDNKYGYLLEARGTTLKGPGLNSVIFRVLLTMPHFLFCLTLIYYSTYKLYTSLKNANFYNHDYTQAYYTHG
jgi:hypothetical protein